jgi:sugar (pentulose or hexulose) kinase
VKDVQEPKGKEQNKALSVIAIFDVGKTNKKLFLFNEQYQIVHEESVRIADTKDEDGDACDDVHALTEWINTSLDKILSDDRFSIRAINFSSFGASFVHVDDNGKPILPLYSYLKPFPPSLKRQFFDAYGGETKIAKETASPVLDHLNSGLQLYRLKYQDQLPNGPGWSLHLPQYLSSLVSGKYYSDITSIGCHTMLWDFEKGTYHEWVKKEQIDRRLAAVIPSTAVVATRWTNIPCGVGLHDSSSALIPYLAIFDEPFLLISTGTWSISMNPFNSSPLTEEELLHDCLCFLSFKGKPVKASRVFAGNEHEKQVKRIADHFNKAAAYAQNIKYNDQVIEYLKRTQQQDESTAFRNGRFNFHERGLSEFSNFEEAYHQLMLDITHQQVLSTNLIINNSIKKIFVDGGFVKNDIYMKLLSLSYPNVEVFGATVAQASAIGAALAIHSHWNRGEVPRTLIELSKANANASLQSPLGA